MADMLRLDRKGRPTMSVTTKQHTCKNPHKTQLTRRKRTCLTQPRSLRRRALDVPPAASRAAISNEGHPLGPTRGLVTHTEVSDLEQDGTFWRLWWLWWWWCGPVCIDDMSVHMNARFAPNYGGRVPVDTAPGPALVCRALKTQPISSSPRR